MTDVTTDIEAGEDAGDTREQAQTNDVAAGVEKRARDMGWVPEDEWRGPKDKWRPAEDFVAFGENNLGLLRKEVTGLRELLQKRDADVRRLVSTMEASQRREYERGLNDAKAKVDAAVAAGDVRAYHAAQKELEAVQSDVKDAAKERAAEVDDGNPAFEAWAAENQWYTTKRPAKVYADTIGPAIMIEMGWDGKSRPTKRMYDAVTAAVKEDHPEWFTNPRREVGSGTEGRSAALSRGGGKGWDDIPADIRQMASSMIGKGQVFATQAEYAKEYFKSNAAR